MLPPPTPLIFEKPHSILENMGAFTQIINLLTALGWGPTLSSTPSGTNPIGSWRLPFTLWTTAQKLCWTRGLGSAQVVLATSFSRVGTVKPTSNQGTKAVTVNRLR